ncbi:unnamed protein product [Owenia fusiformis]|uniref:Hexosyltransferase n=1 Tax=Owenia fusiformis TaxID=6347 RepID=A0A8J1USU3_OWEFU|nr:unnamed protein product [Owenia fusiformis]
MLWIHKIFMLVLCIQSITFALLGLSLYQKIQTVQKVSRGQLDQLSVGRTRRGTIIYENGIKEHQGSASDTNTSERNEPQRNNNTIPTVQQASKGQKWDHLPMVDMKRSRLINANQISKHEGNVTGNNTSSSLGTIKRRPAVIKNILLGNNNENKAEQTNQQMTMNTSSILLDYQQVLKNGNFSMNKSVNISELRLDKCDACFPQSSYIYKNDNLCSTNNSNNSNNSTTLVKLLVIIFTVHNGTKTRNILRKTWASISKNNTRELRYVFLLGKHTKDPEWNVRVLAEAKKYGDILIKDFMDEFRNLTLKTMSGLKWAAEFCSNAKYIMKTDSDMWVNTPRLLRYIDLFNIENEIIGTCLKKSKPIRHKESKYYASPEEYPHMWYPSFCSGTGYVTTMKVVKDIVKVSPDIPFFFLEDIYVGLCNKALGYKVRRVKGFQHKRVKLSVCGYNQIFTSHRIQIAEIEKVWNINFVDQTFQH